MRRAAFDVVKSKVDLKSLTIQQRNFLVKSGLKDRDDTVRQTCQAMVRESWLPKRDNNIVSVRSPCAVRAPSVALMSRGPPAQLLEGQAADTYPEEADLTIRCILAAPENGAAEADTSNTPSPPYNLATLTPEKARRRPNGYLSPADRVLLRRRCTGVCSWRRCASAGPMRPRSWTPACRTRSSSWRWSKT